MEDEINLREVLQTLWDGRRLLAGIIAAALLTSGLVSLFVVEPVYESSVVLSVQEVTVPEAEGGTPLVKIYNQPTIGASEAVEGFSRALRDPELLAGAGRILGSQEPPAPETFAGDVTVENPEETNLVFLTARAETPQKAAELTTFLSERFNDYVYRQNRTILTQRLRALNEQLDSQLRSLDAGIESMQEQLEQVAPTLRLTEAIVDNPLLQQGAAMESSRSPEELASELAALREELNPAYLTFLASLSDLQARHARAQADKARVEQVLGNEERISYLALTTGTVASPLSQAYVPTEKVSPRVGLNLVLAALLGGLAGTFTVLFLSFWRNGGKMASFGIEPGA